MVLFDISTRGMFRISGTFGLSCACAQPGPPFARGFAVDRYMFDHRLPHRKVAAKIGVVTHAVLV